MSARSAPLRRSASSAPSSRRSVMTAFQRATTMANFMPAAERSPSRATGLPLRGSVQAQKLKAKAGLGLDGEDLRLPVRFCDGRKAGDGRFSALRAEPRFGSLVDGIERGDFDEDVGGGGKLAVDKFEIAERCEKGRAATGLPPAIPCRARSPGQQRSWPAGHRPLRCRRDEERRCP